MRSRTALAVLGAVAGARSRTALAVLGVVAGASCGGSAPDARPAPQASLKSVVFFEGVVLVTDLKTVRYTPDYLTCVTHGSTADIRQGTQVVVHNDRGLRVAVGFLLPGRLTKGQAGPAGCAFPFNMSNAPGGSRTYTVQVGERSPVTVDAATIDRIVLPVP